MTTSKKSTGRSLRALVFGVALLAGVGAYARPARACTWWLACADSLISGGWGWIKDLGGGIGQFAVRNSTGALLASINCTRSDIGGVAGACFPVPGTRLDRMNAAMAFINADQHAYLRGYTTAPEGYLPTNFIRSRAAYFVDGTFAQANTLVQAVSHTAGLYASTLFVATGSAAPIVIWSRAYDYGGTIGLADVLVHESDHTRFGWHSHGSTMDEDESGPYGTEIQYLGAISRQYSNLALANVDRETAWALGVADLAAIFDESAQNRVWNAALIDPPSVNDPLVLAARASWQVVVPGAAVSQIAVVHDRGADGWPRPLLFTIGDADGKVYSSRPGLGGWSPYGSWVGPSTPFVQVAAVMTGFLGSTVVVYGVGVDGCVYSSTAGGGWTKVTPGWVSRIAVTSDGTIYGISRDHDVWRTTAGGNWTWFASTWVSDIAATQDGTVYGVGNDNAVWRTTGGGWVQVAEPAVTQIAVTPRGTLYGLDLNGQVVMTRASVLSLADRIAMDGVDETAWRRVVNYGQVTSIAVSPDGFIYAIDLNKFTQVHGSYMP